MSFVDGSSPSLIELNRGFVDEPISSPKEEPFIDPEAGGYRDEHTTPLPSSESLLSGLFSLLIRKGTVAPPSRTTSPRSSPARPRAERSSSFLSFSSAAPIVSEVSAPSIDDATQWMYPPTADALDAMEGGESKELVQDEFFYPCHRSRNWVKCTIVRESLVSFKLFHEPRGEDDHERFLLSGTFIVVCFDLHTRSLSLLIFSVDQF